MVVNIVKGTTDTGLKHSSCLESLCGDSLYIAALVIAADPLDQGAACFTCYRPKQMTILRPSHNADAPLTPLDYHDILPCTWL